MPILRVWAPDMKTHESSGGSPSEQSPPPPPRKRRREREVMGGTRGAAVPAGRRGTLLLRHVKVLDFRADRLRYDPLPLAVCTQNRQPTNDDVWTPTKRTTTTTTTTTTIHHVPPASLHPSPTT